MSDLLLRNVDDHLIQHLMAQAAVQGTNVEDYVKAILTSNVTHSRPKDNSAREYQLKEFVRKADALAEGMAPQTIDSADIIREERECL